MSNNVINVKIRYENKQELIKLDHDLTLFDLKMIIMNKWKIKHNIILVNFPQKLTSEHDDKLLSELNINNCMLTVDEDIEKQVMIKQNDLDKIHVDSNDCYKKMLEKINNDKKIKEDIMKQYKEDREEANTKSNNYVKQIKKEQDIKNKDMDVKNHIKVKTNKRVLTFKCKEDMTLRDLLQKLNKKENKYTCLKSFDGDNFDLDFLAEAVKGDLIIAS